jgi:choice-of-anchor B domain-containing protein
MNKLYLFIFLLCPVFLNGQSQNMNLVGQWNGATSNYNDVWGYTDYSGKEYAIIGSKTKVHFLDISIPNSPQLIDEFELGSNTTWRDFKTYSHFAYAVSEGDTGEGLAIFDLCDIEKGIIKKVYQQNNVFRRAHNIYIDAKNARLYVVGSDTRNQGVIIYDLATNAAKPTLVGNLDLQGGYIHDIFVKDHIAFCSHGFNGLYIYDFTNPSQPVFQSNITTQGYNHSSWGFTEDSLLIYAEEVPMGLPMGIIDYKNSKDNDLEIVSTFKAPILEASNNKNTAHNPYMVGNYAIVSYYEDGLVIFDLTNPQAPRRIAYYDTYPDNSDYTGYNGCWGTYPFLPSGNILASDISRGLYILRPTFSLTNTCNNGKQDWNETGIDCGGVCKSCQPCYPEICDNGIDDDRDGKIDCLDESCDCPGSQSIVQIKLFLEGFFDANTNRMTSQLKEKRLLPDYQPFKVAPYFYKGTEQLTTTRSDIIDWVLVEARDAIQYDKILSVKAALLLADGSLIQPDGTFGLQFGEIATEAIHLVVRHKGHLAVMSKEVIDMRQNTAYDFTGGSNKAEGRGQLKQVGSKFCLHVGDFDQNGIINNLDYNIWKKNRSLINRYLTYDSDGNGIINNLDYNNWALNRSKVGAPVIRMD